MRLIFSNGWFHYDLTETLHKGIVNLGGEKRVSQIEFSSFIFLNFKCMSKDCPRSSPKMSIVDGKT